MTSYVGALQTLDDAQVLRPGRYAVVRVQKLSYRLQTELREVLEQVELSGRIEMEARGGWREGRVQGGVTGIWILEAISAQGMGEDLNSSVSVAGVTYEDL